MWKTLDILSSLMMEGVSSVKSNTVNYGGMNLRVHLLSQKSKKGADDNIITKQELHNSPEILE